MESPCYRCGAPVEEGSAFCSSCNAPQIKVAVPQPPANEVFMRPPEMVPPEALPTSSTRSGAIEWRKYRRLALPLSLLAGVGMAVFAPLGLLFFVGSIVFVVLRYRRDHLGPLRAMQGAKMGAFNGLISFLVATAVDAALFHAEYRQQMMVELNRRFAGNPDPQVQHFVQWAGTNQGFAVLVIFSLIFLLVIFLIVSSFIGAVSVSFSTSKDRR